MLLWGLLFERLLFGVSFSGGSFFWEVLFFGENNALGGGDQRLLRGVYVGHHERSGAAIFLTPDGVKRGTRAILAQAVIWFSALLCEEEGFFFLLWCSVPAS